MDSSRQNSKNTSETLWLRIVYAKSGSVLGVFRAFFLWPLSLVYRFGFAISKLLAPKALELRIPLIVVGGMTVGGAGKTPLVALLVRLLQAKGKNVAVVCSGYGRKDKTALIANGVTLLSRPASETGDEPRELAEQFPEVFFAVCESKREALGALSMMKSLDVIVVDDGFQSRGLDPDFSIVLINSRSVAADFRLLPVGRLREPMEALQRANVVIYSKLDSIDNKPEQQITKAVGSNYTGVTFNSAINLAVSCVYPTHSEASQGQELLGAVLLVSGLADNSDFCRSAERLDIQSVGSIGFPDHFQYDTESVADIATQAKELGAAAILTSAKDWVKLKEFDWSLQVWVMTVRAEISEEEKFSGLMFSEIFPISNMLD